MEAALTELFPQKNRLLEDFPLPKLSVFPRLLEVLDTGAELRFFCPLDFHDLTCSPTDFWWAMRIKKRFPRSCQKFVLTSLAWTWLFYCLQGCFWKMLWDFLSLLLDNPRWVSFAPEQSCSENFRGKLSKGFSIRHRFIVEIVKEKCFEYLDTAIVTRIVARLTLFARSPAVLSMFLPIVN